MADPIPGEWLSAAALAIGSQPAGSSSAHLARVALEAAVPLIRATGEDAGVEWGVRFTVGGVNERPLPSEEDARTVVANMRENRPEFGAVLIVRVPEVPAGPWRLADEPATVETEEGDG